MSLEQATCHDPPYTMPRVNICEDISVSRQEQILGPRRRYADGTSPNMEATSGDGSHKTRPGCAFMAYAKLVVLTPFDSVGVRP